MLRHNEPRGSFVLSVSTRMRRACARVTVGLLAGAMTAGFLVGGSAGAAPAAGHDQIVSATAGKTPGVDNGEVDAIAEVGNAIVIGGTFTSVTPLGGTSTPRSYLFAFDKATGQLLPGFNPVLNGAVNDVVPGPTPGTVYAAGAFSQVNGASSSKVTLLRLDTGAVVSGFRAAAMNGAANTIVAKGSRLFVGGFFTTVGGQAHSGIASLNATSGAVDAFVNNQMAERHNTASTGAKGPVGVRDLDVSADGTRLIAIGNFRKVDGLDRDQAVMLSLDGDAATVTADWSTNRYKHLCFNWAYDSYMRGVSFSPDGSFLVIATTGGQNSGSLCDTAARFETSASSNDLQPTWVNYTGGDTLWAVAVTEQAVYVGGHQRWLNNSLGSDYANSGAVPRPGLAALDLDTGLPLKWNPGRNPRGAAVFALLPTSDGLWLGSDTEYLGNFSTRRPRLAFFPLAGGAKETSDSTANVPGTLFSAGSTTAVDPSVLYRVNAGGGTLSTLDSAADWAAEGGSYRSGSSSSSSYTGNIAVDGTVPATTPVAVFNTERYGTSSLSPFRWAFPAAQSIPLQVRLYFANRASATNTVGKRVFDVSIDGTKVLDNFDVVAATGNARGTMRAFNLTSDGTVNIDFGREVNNPLVNAIEVVRTDIAPSTGSDLRAAAISNSSVGPAASFEDDSALDWKTVRGSFYAGGRLWYGKSDGTFNYRTFAEGSFGPQVKVDPYNDPAWAGVATGSGNTYDGKVVDLYGQMASVTGMAYQGGRLYYTRSGDANLYWKWFNADSGIIGSATFTANGGRSWTGTQGMFAADGKLYFVSAANGALSSMPLTTSGPTGSPTVVDSPATGGNDWRSRALFLADGTVQPPNKLPTAAFTTSCDDLSCVFDGSASSDPDGTDLTYSWSFGDGTTGEGASPQHAYTGAGSYEVVLTVTDPRGGVGQVSRQVSVTGTHEMPPVTHVDAAAVSATSAAPRITLPATIQPGDTLLLTAAIGSGGSATAPSGWTVVADQPNTTGFRTMVWSRQAVAGDAGSVVTLSLGATAKTNLTVSAYRGGDNGVAVSSVTSTSDAATATHTTPGATVPGGAWVVSIWTEKSPSTTAYTVPTSAALRAQAYSTATGRVSTAVADSNGPVAGVVPGSTATTDAASTRGINFTVVLTPQ